MIVIPHFFGGIAILSFGTVLIVVAQTAEDFQLKIVTTSAPELGEGTTANWGQRGALLRLVDRRLSHGRASTVAASQSGFRSRPNQGSMCDIQSRGNASR
jgi:hypothetical protein